MNQDISVYTNYNQLDLLVGVKVPHAFLESLQSNPVVELGKMRRSLLRVPSLIIALLLTLELSEVCNRAMKVMKSLIAALSLVRCSTEKMERLTGSSVRLTRHHSERI